MQPLKTMLARCVGSVCAALLIVAVLTVSALYFLNVPDSDARWWTLPILLVGAAAGALVTGGVLLKHDARQHQVRERLASIMEASADFISFTDPDNKTLYVNQAGRNLLGLGDRELTGKSFADFCAPWAAELLRDEGIPTALRDGTWYGETALLSRGGSEIPVSQVIVAHKRADGSLEYLSTIARDISERKHAELRLTRLAQYDALTGLPNRSLFYDRLAQAMARSLRGEQPLALMFLDLDRFKNINDTLGHGAGDQVLRGVAERLKLCLREVDTIARLGGDEFTIVLEDVKRVEQTAAVAQKILDTLAHPQIIDGEEIFVSASIGVILFPEHAGDIDGMLKKADIAMYHAKAQGRNNYQFYTAEMEGAGERVGLESKLRRALERGELRLYYQPLIELRSGRITGAEALLRWQHPEMGLLDPEQFIGLAEETGLIVPIGEWVLNSACLQNKLWQDAGLGPLRINVNLSARQFRRADLQEVIDAALRNADLAPDYLGLEITEGLLMDNAKASGALLAAFQERGVHIAIDDFGTGYSSLSYLKHFPLNVLKIDQSFVRHMTSDAHSAALAKSIITLGHSLQLKVIAEGVETAEQLAFLRGEGCDGMQGFLFSEPLPAEAMTQLLRDRQRGGVAEQISRYQIN
ncbi:MAG: EAL domain-containing protein [Pseudomonadota bacterium]